MTDKRKMELIKILAFEVANIKYMNKHKFNCEDILFMNNLKSKLKYHFKGEIEGISMEGMLNEEKNQTS